MTADHNAFRRMLSESTDEELEATAADYIWLAEFGPKQGRYTYEATRDQVVEGVRAPRAVLDISSKLLRSGGR